jgi:hypothetical protein
MRSLIALGVVVATLAATLAPAHACSARGRYCGYPVWAANAFEDAQGRAPSSAIALPAPAQKRKAR